MQTSNLSTPVPNENTALLTATVEMQSLYRKNRAYHAISDFLQFKIDQTSQRNFDSIRKCLREDTAKFEKNIAENHTKRVLTREEAQLFEFILENLTLKHSTHFLEDIKENGNELLSIRERIRRSKKISNSHTGSHHNRDDFLYFTLGMGDHQSIYSGNRSEIIVHPLELMKKDKHALAGLWVSSHDRDFDISSISRPILFSETKHYYSHNKGTKEKTYFFERNDQITTKTVKYAEEIFSGRHVLPGVAYYFLHLLRLIGGSYRENLLAKAANPTIALEEKQKMLTAAMDYLLPGWQFPETKIPVRFSLNHPAVEIQDIEAVRKKRNYQPIDSDLYKAIKDHNLEKLRELADKGTDFSVRFLPPSTATELTPVELAIKDPDDPDTLHGNRSLHSSDKILNTVEFLVSNGAIIHEPGSNPLLMAIQDIRYSLVEYFLKLTTVDSRDPSITLLSNPNETLHEESHPLYILLSSPHGTITEIADMLKLLLKHGSDPKLVGNILLRLAAVNKSFKKGKDSFSNIKFLQQLLDAGLDASENPEVGSSLLIILAHSNELAEMQFLIDHGADINFRFQINCPVQEEGYTALHFAVQKSPEAAALLLKAGANPLIAGTNEKKPVDLAIEAGDKSLAALIRSYEKKFAPVAKTVSLESVVNDDLPKTFIPLHIHSAAALIVGRDRKGNKVVILGTKRTAEGKNPRQIFPGGYKSIHDASFLEAAIREVEEETNLELGKWIKEDGIQPIKLHRHESTNLAKNKKFVIEFHLFDVGSRLEEIKLIAKDDLVKLSKYELNNKITRPVCHSNDILLKVLQDGIENKDWQEQLDIALAIETDAVAKLHKALEENNEAMLNAICSHPALLDAKEGIEIDKLLKIASRRGSKANIDSLLSYAKLLDPKKQWEKIFSCGAKLGDMTIIETALAAGNFEMIDYTCAAEEAAKKGHVHVIDYLYDKVRNKLTTAYKPIYEEKGSAQKFDSPEMKAKHYWLESILNAGAAKGHLEIYQYVSKQMKISETLHKQILRSAANKARKNFIIEMLTLVKDDPVKHRDLLQYSLQQVVYSTKSNYPSVVELLIRMGANPFDYPINSCDKTPLLSLDSLKTELNNRPSFSRSECTPLSAAAISGNEKLADLLMTCKTPKDSDYFNHSLALIYAASDNRTALVEKLLDDGRINLFTTHEGKTAMMYAIKKKHFKIAVDIAYKHLSNAVGDPSVDINRFEEEDLAKYFDNREYAQMIFNLIHYKFSFFLPT
jgi:ankyrin repeat protein